MMTNRNFPCGNILLAAVALLAVVITPSPSSAAEVINYGIGGCLTAQPGIGGVPLVANCDGSGEQQWKWSEAGQILSADGRCLSFHQRTYDENGNLISITRFPTFIRNPGKLYPCDGAEDQRWNLSRSGQIFSVPDPAFPAFYEEVCLLFLRFRPDGGPTRAEPRGSLDDCAMPDWRWAIDVGGFTSP